MITMTCLALVTLWLVGSLFHSHVLGTPVDQDQIVHEEPDERFFLNIGKTQDQRFILCGLGSSITSECLFIDANHPGDKFQVFLVH